MSNIIHIGDAAKRVVEKAKPREITMDSPVVAQLKGSIARLDCQGEEEAKVRLLSEQRRRRIEDAIRDMRKNEGDLATIDFLADTLGAITGSGA